MLQPHIETHGAHSGKCSDTRPPDPHPRLFFEQLAYLSAFSFTIQPSVKHFEEFLWVSFKFSASKNSSFRVIKLASITYRVMLA